MPIESGVFDESDFTSRDGDKFTLWDTISPQERAEILAEWKAIMRGAQKIMFPPLERKNADGTVTKQPDFYAENDDGIEYAYRIASENLVMRPILVLGLLRLGETMNIIAPPKMGKSWLAMNLAVSVATGTPWFGFPCMRGKVLIIDNELHKETIANRLQKVCEARGMKPEDLAYDLAVWSMRGENKTIDDLKNDLKKLKRHDFRLIIIDALYRAIPPDVEENDNAAMMRVYNSIDKCAKELNCSFVLIHHTTKGNQSFKSVTDVGAGAGSISRAADTHLILRHHRVAGAIVMEAVVRSFRAVPPVCIRRNGTNWVRDDKLNANELEGTKRNNNNSKKKPSGRVTVAEIAEKLVKLVKDPPLTKGDFIKLMCDTYSIKEPTAQNALKMAIANGSVLCKGLKNPPPGKHAAQFIQLPPSGSEAK